jgi:hypothetical protein
MSVPPLPSPADAFDATGRVGVDTACVRCGYNLRTLLADGVCPECGETVAASIQEFFLHFAPAAWLRDLARGLRLVLVGLGCSIVLPIIVGVIAPLTITYNPTRIPAWSSDSVLFSGAVHGLAHVVGGVLLIVGLVWLTRREPRQQQQPEGYTARRIIRLCCWLLPIPTLGGLILSLSAPTIPPLTPGAPPPPGLIGPWFADFALLATIVGLAQMGIYATAALAVLRLLAALMRRIPRPGLVRGARVAFWGLLCGTGLLLIGVSAMTLTVVPGTSAMLAAAAAAGTTTAPTTLPTPSNPDASASAEDESQAESQPATTALATAPATMPAFPPMTGPSFLVRMVLGGCGSGLGGCGTLIFGVIAVSVLIRACGALFTAARAADAIARG